MKFQKFLQFREDVQARKGGKKPTRQELLINERFGRLYSDETLDEASNTPLESIAGIGADFVNEGIFGTIKAWLKLKSLLPKYTAALKASALSNAGSPEEKPEKEEKEETDPKKPAAGAKSAPNPAVQAATEKVATATAAVATAKTALADLQKKDPPATPEEITTAETAVTTATKAETDTKTALTAAKETAAKEAPATAGGDHRRAHAKLTAAQTKLTDLQKKDPPATAEEITTAETAVKDAQAAVTKAEEAPDAETGAETDATEDGGAKEKLAAAKTALAELKKKEPPAEAKEIEAAETAVTTAQENLKKEKDTELVTKGLEAIKLKKEELAQMSGETDVDRAKKIKFSIAINKAEAQLLVKQGKEDEAKEQLRIAEEQEETLKNLLEDIKKSKSKPKPAKESASFALEEDSKAQSKAEDEKIKQIAALIDQVAADSGSEWIKAMASQGKIEAEIAKTDAVIKAAKSEEEKVEAKGRLEKLQKRLKGAAAKAEEGGEGEDPKEELKDGAEKMVKQLSEEIGQLEEERTTLMTEIEELRSPDEAEEPADPNEAVGKIVDLQKKRIVITEKIIEKKDECNKLIKEFELGDDEKSIETEEELIENIEKEIKEEEGKVVDAAEDAGIDTGAIKTATAEDSANQQAAEEAEGKVAAIQQQIDAIEGGGAGGGDDEAKEKAKGMIAPAEEEVEKHTKEVLTPLTDDLEEEKAKEPKDEGKITDLEKEVQNGKIQGLELKLAVAKHKAEAEGKKAEEDEAYKSIVDELTAAQKVEPATEENFSNTSIGAKLEEAEEVTELEFLKKQLADAKADFEIKKKKAIEGRNKLNAIIKANSEGEKNETAEPATEPAKPAPAKILTFSAFMEKKKSRG